MTSCWPVAPLGALVDCLDARRVPLNRAQRAQRSGVVPYHGASGITGYVDQALFDGALVLLGEDGAPFLDPGRDVAFFHEGPLWAGNHVHVLRPRAGMDGRFLAHALNTVCYAAHVDGTTRRKLVRARMNSLPVPCPPLYRQQAIAAMLDHAMQRIDDQMAELARQAALAGEWIRAETQHAIGHDGGVWPPSVPPGHVIRPLAALFDITGGGTPATIRPENWGGDVTWITPADLPDGPPAWITGGARSLSATGLESCRASVVPAGALVVSTRAPVGRVGIGRGPLSVSQGCKALVRRTEDVDPCYAALFLHAAGSELRRRAGGSVFAELDTATLASLELCLPPLPTQREIAQTVWRKQDRHASQVRARERVAAHLGEYRVALRVAAVNGQLTC